jgi:hypothetical protein
VFLLQGIWIAVLYNNNIIGIGMVRDMRGACGYDCVSNTVVSESCIDG